MNFAEFVKSLPRQKDKDIDRFIALVEKDADFPTTSEPSKLAIYLYKKLNSKQTATFQKLLLFYGSMPFNQLPEICQDHEMMLMAVNLIVGLQNFDNDYPYN